jgi:hypothetical protein
MFFTIANRQVNINAILGADIPKEGRLKLYLDHRAAPLVSGLKNTHYTAGSSDQPLILELTGEPAEEFRKQWHYATQSIDVSVRLD